MMTKNDAPLAAGIVRLCPSMIAYYEHIEFIVC